MGERSLSSRRFLTAKKRVDCLLSWASIPRHFKRSMRTIASPAVLDLATSSIRKRLEPSDWSRTRREGAVEGVGRQNGGTFSPELRCRLRLNRTLSAFKKPKSTIWKESIKRKRKPASPKGAITIFCSKG